MMRLLRRVAALALLVAAGLLLIPRVLYHFGFVGPSPAERLDAARRAVRVARDYGARPEEVPALAAAERELKRAEELAARGDRHDALDAAEEALRTAGQAQQVAIVNRDGMRLRAKETIDTLDRRVDELEELYSARSKGVGPDRARDLFSRMKQARAASAALVLAWEQQDYRKVLEGRDRVLRVLDEMKRELQASPGGAT